MSQPLLPATFNATSRIQPMSYVLCAINLLVGIVTLFAAMTGANAADDHGHDHGDAPAAASGPALPRFAAASDLFEMVGVLSGNRLTLYLDRFRDNSPVEDARIEVEVGGREVKANPHGVGEFEVMLDVPPPPGILAVTAVIHAGAESDLLAGELDVHEAHQDDTSGASGWSRLQVAGTVSLVLLLLCLIAWAVRRHRHPTPAAGVTS